MKLKKRFLASIMSILILSSFSQLTGFADEEAASHEVFATLNSEVDLDLMQVQKLQDYLETGDKEDPSKLKTIRKLAAAVGPNALTQFICDNYNVKIEFDSMKSVINKVSDNLEITEWNCDNNKIKITNNSDEVIKAHIGVEFDDTYGIKDVSLGNFNDLSNIALPKDEPQEKKLQLNGGKIEINANTDILNKFYTKDAEGNPENGAVKIGVAKVFITNKNFVNSFNELANSLKDFAENTQNIAKLSTNSEIKSTAANLLETAEGLPAAVEKFPKEYNDNVDALVKYLTDHQGKLNGLNVKLCISNETFNQAITTFVKLNNELSDKVGTTTQKPVKTVKKLAELQQEVQNKQSSDSSAVGSDGSSGNSLSGEEKKVAAEKGALGKLQGEINGDNSNSDTEE